MIKIYDFFKKKFNKHFIMLGNRAVWMDVERKENRMK